jgi:hypothetical protein
VVIGNDKEETSRWGDLRLGSMVNRFQGLETGEVQEKKSMISGLFTRRTTVERKNWGLVAGISFEIPSGKLSLTFSTKPARWDFKRRGDSKDGKFVWMVGQLKFHVKL